MTPDVCLVKIEELEELKSRIEQRIKELREHAGITANFHERLKFVREDILELFVDRTEEDDDQSIWDMVCMLRTLTNECLTYLMPRQ